MARLTSKPLSEEHKKKISEANKIAMKGRRVSVKSEFKKGNPPPKHKFNCSCFRCSGKAWNKGIAWMKGHKFKRHEVAGKRNVNWKGGVSSEKEKARKTMELVHWKRAVLNRDNFSCVVCSSVGGELHIHHIKSFAQYPLLRADINNGITLCVTCHKEIHRNKSDDN